MAEKRQREASNKDSEDSQDRTGREPRRPGENTSHPGGRSTRGNKKSVSFAEPIAEEKPETDTPGAKKKAVFVSDAKRQKERTQADGKSVIGGVAGFYTCDGGCDRATITNA